jgi:hypothetical protein
VEPFVVDEAERCGTEAWSAVYTRCVVAADDFYNAGMACDRYKPGSAGGRKQDAGTVTIQSSMTPTRRRASRISAARPSGSI